MNTKAKTAKAGAAPESDEARIAANPGVETNAEPAWLAEPEYSGSLTADQAERRIARYGRYTKPAPEAATK